MDDRLRWKSGSDVEAASTPVVRPRSKGPAASAVGGGVGSKVSRRQIGLGRSGGPTHSFPDEANDFTGSTPYRTPYYRSSEPYR